MNNKCKPSKLLKVTLAAWGVSLGDSRRKPAAGGKDAPKAHVSVAPLDCKDLRPGRLIVQKQNREHRDFFFFTTPHFDFTCY